MSSLLPRRARKQRGRGWTQDKSKGMGRIKEKPRKDGGEGGVKRKRAGKARKTD